MDSKYLLPALTSDIKPTSDKCWDRRDDAYDFLLKNLKLEYEPKESVFDGGSSAMPHMFEQMLIFNQAFEDPRNPDHERAIAEWRAIFILMALKRIKNIKLDLVKVDLNGKSSNPFLQAVSRFKPEKSPVLFNTTWDFTYVLTLDENPIALFSPVTIVCPAKTFNKRIQSLEWLKIQKVNNKEVLLLKFNTRGNEYTNITEWLLELKKNLFENRNEKNDTSTVFECVMRELGQTISEYSHHATQRLRFLPKHNVYSSINNNIRREYCFLNVCCDFELQDKRMEFLVDKYTEDVFYEKLLLLAYDDKPGSIASRDNLNRLHRLVNQIMKLNGKEIIAVRDNGGEKMALFALLPFKQEFIEDLIKHDISSADFFEEYEAVYDRDSGYIEINATIKNFPYSFTKRYRIGECKTIYGEEMASIYIWPQETMKEIGWNTYYTYVSQNNSNMEVTIHETKMVRHAYTPSPSSPSPKKIFKLLRTRKFPNFICLTKEQVSGYLPLMETPVKNQQGKTATIFIDIGHTTTYVDIITQDGLDPEKRNVERVKLRRPKSLWVFGDSSKDTSVGYNFVPPKTDSSTKNDFKDPQDSAELVDKRNYFKNTLNDFQNYTKTPDDYTLQPFEDGQVLFTDRYYQMGMQDALMSFINFEYAMMNNQKRKQVHIFLEQIMMYILHNAIIAGCSAFRVRFLHMMQENSEAFGELKGLWDDVLKKVIRKTGGRIAQEKGIGCCSESEALAYSVYHKRNGKIGMDDGKNICVGLDIGWGKSVAVRLKQNLGNTFTADYRKMDFGGKNISFLDKEVKFNSYINSLSVLLSNSYDTLNQGDHIQLLNEFSQLYEGTSVDENYYYGLFDLIAMRIEKDDFLISPDLYNQKSEFRSFIKMITCNILLLFLETGIFIGKSISESGDSPKDKLHIDLYCGGNGSKFLNWISNLKGVSSIDETNCHELFIVGLKRSILDVIKVGINIVYSSCLPENMECTINFPDNAKGFLLEGYIFSEYPDLYSEEVKNLQVQSNLVSMEINDTEKKKAVSEIDCILEDVFGDDEALHKLQRNSGGTQPLESLEQAIIRNSKEVCEAIANAIDGSKGATV